MIGSSLKNIRGADKTIVFEECIISARLVEPRLHAIRDHLSIVNFVIELGIQMNKKIGWKRYCPLLRAYRHVIDAQAYWLLVDL